MPVAVCPELVMCESGDYNFYVRRGYAQVFAKVRVLFFVRVAERLAKGPVGYRGPGQ